MKGLYLAAAAIGGVALLASKEASASVYGSYSGDDYPAEFTDEDYNVIDYSDKHSDNLAAFLAALRLGESSDNYYALVGGGSFSDDSAHPRENGWEGIRRSDDGRLTTAAGAYQITYTTWKDVRAALGLTDFSEDSQDRAAVWLIKRRGALQAVQEGDMNEARRLLQNEWEILKVRDVAWLSQVFTANGGVTA